VTAQHADRDTGTFRSWARKYVPLPVRRAITQAGWLCYDFRDAFAEAVGQQDSHRLVGRLPYAQMPRCPSAADILLQHPLDLGNAMRLPAKIPEYLAMGKPVVTYSQGIGETLTRERAVVGLESSDWDEAAAAVLRVASDPDLRERLGQRARQFAEARFDWERNAEQQESIYRTALDV